MLYKVLSASLGREDKVYMQSEYIELELKDAERLSSFGCVLMEKAKEVENTKEVKGIEPHVRKPFEGVKHVMDPLKVPDTGVIKGKKKEANKK